MAIKKVGVVGAGMMGAGITMAFAMNGLDVVMSDATAELAKKAKEGHAASLDRNIARGKIEASEKDKILARITPTGDLKDMADCDLVIEAAPEITEMKMDIFKKLDEYTKPECILASNTSSISITLLASAVSKERVGQFIGLHFFSPAQIMKLVEIIPAVLTDQATIDICRQCLLDIKKTPILVKDVVGFAVNRVLHAMLVEAQRCLEEGVATAEDIDIGCKLGLGHSVGPFELMDTTSIHLNVQVEKVLFDAYGDRFRSSQILLNMDKAGLNGKRTGRGFYNYE